MATESRSDQKKHKNKNVRNGSLGLCIGVEAYFYGWCNTNPNFGIWSGEMAQLKSFCLAGTSGLEIPILPTGHQTLHVGK